VKKYDDHTKFHKNLQIALKLLGSVGHFDRNNAFRIYLLVPKEIRLKIKIIQGGSNMTGTDCIVNKIKSAPVIFEPPCILKMFFEHHFKNNEIDRACGMYGKQETCTDGPT
jgi:hypothetical protein